MADSLSQKIQQFYDASSGLWEQIWGEHMHHGYYGEQGRHRKPRRQAQIDLIDKVLAWGKVRDAAQILDVGCGIGGSALVLAERFGGRVTGVTLSPVQAERARERANAVGLGDQVTFRVADALQTPFADQGFDLVWSMESGEHMPDKVAFLRECYRLLKPGGQLLMATWCHRPTESLGGGLTLDEIGHLEILYQVYHLPYVISLPAYGRLAQQVGFTGIRLADWSVAVAPFWDAVIESVFAARCDRRSAADRLAYPAGSSGLRIHARWGFDRGLVRYGLLSAIR
ncbi:2-methyl-6-phytyl-1,4-hydroquinone methyltransferase [Halomicronema hongdechloris C2206]|uniref:2-methyl-6-phytyl-1,4-hydroquinone methyltransferase n=1 Tax=Halomicronema hongdechloris C2206 TaxID=1641165 RepID=A0A1Z3HK86_9CYAN|nr:methyltransferase domain-containing protein [Halomicronema hongdechloris]ASC70713.1 2-methyl-6-phytyl-1,4-hydroquinone methyltransferase [Halomicronema hongdechloris C2206]